GRRASQRARESHRRAGGDEQRQQQAERERQHEPEAGVVGRGVLAALALHHPPQEGQRDGVFDDTLESRLVSRSMFGALDEVLLELTLTRTDSEDVAHKAEQVSRMLLEGLTAGN
ncbi:MAG: hypothetical protein ABEN55_14620, partial [Bradymonadaceae bacterium]